MNRNIQRFLKPIATLLILGWAWEILCRALEVPDYLLPPPSAIVKAMFGVSADVWLSHIWATFSAAAAGYLVAILVSLSLAALMTRYQSLGECINPLLVIVSSTPVVAIAPVLVVSLGANQGTRIVIVALICFFPLVVGALAGLSSAPSELIELSRSLRAPRYREFTQIRFPIAVPHIFSALKVSVTLAIIGAVVAEFVAAEQGLGYFLRFSTSNFQVAQGFGALGVLIVMSLALYGIVVGIQRWLFPWSLPGAKTKPKKSRTKTRVTYADGRQSQQPVQASSGS